MKERVDGVGIVLLASLPAVNDDGGQRWPLLSRYAAQDITNKRLEVLLHMLLRQFVHFQSLSLVATWSARHVGSLFRFTYFYAVWCPVAHSFIGPHPRPARLAPARTVEESHLYAELAGGFQCHAQVRPPQAALELVLSEGLALPGVFPSGAVADVRS